ncbi:outer membrane lipoprotein carrier protein LolA [Christiangramia sp. SM2212]|uniref:Outer membrane lipoprotein carrier protein LolA n=1 Tax=Christiangramia sediminicola TaxID=3073267 RepID=A0ABU1EPN4_9FLAO|nr:outer membrane lipoprotein carrier protein LolA [Christiangramia sp. SM2212]MDR5590331.1 outer membrane lipoprotein carrier protein LolA [Christiangramia sp. SM2212]
MRIIKLCIFLFSINMLAQNGTLNNSEKQAFKASVIQKSNDINSFSAEFSQKKHMKTMDGSPESEGKVYYKSPNTLKWEYTSPYDYQLLFKDSKLFIVEEGQLSEVDLTSNKLFDKMGELVAGSVNGKILMADKDFDITYHHAGENVKALIIPKDDSLRGMFKEIWINFNPELLIRSVRLIDPSGDYTEISMKNIKINQPIPSSVFQN